MTTPPALPPPAASAAAFDFVASLRVVTDDPAWLRKLLVGSLVTLFGILVLPLPLLIGYQLRVVRNTARGDARPIPEWEDWGGLFMDGLRVLALIIPHQLAFMLAVGAPFAAIVLGGAALGDNAGPLVMLLLLPLGLLTVAAALVFAGYVQVAQIRLAVTDNLGAAFDFAANAAFLRRSIIPLLLAFGVLLVTNFVAQFGVLLCCVGLIPATLWSQIAFHHGLGQVARLGAAPKA